MPAIESIKARSFTVPTDGPESDGTLEWDSTTIIIVELEAGDESGLGYSYTHSSAGTLINATLADCVVGADALSIPAIHARLTARIRNLGETGITGTALSAIDIALWDLKAKLLGVPLVSLLGKVRDDMRIYGSGGFTSYDDERLAEQMGGWAARGLREVKMKVGRDKERDLHRVELAREAIGPETGLMVDANSAYQVKEAIRFAQEFDDAVRIVWLEQPVAYRDRAGLRLIRERLPAEIEVADGEYGYELSDFRDFIEDGAVDVMMADVTRCGGISGFIKAASLCEAHNTPLSSHCAPLATLPLGCSQKVMRHGEYFYDHARIESLFFDGCPQPQSGTLFPDDQRPGLGVTLKEPDIREFED